MTGADQIIGDRDARSLHEVYLELAEIADVILATLFDPKCRTVSTYHESRVSEGQALALRQEAVESQSLTFGKVNDVEVVLMLLQPDIGMIRHTRGPGGVNSRLVRHRQRDQPHTFFCPVVIYPIDHVAVGGMTTEQEEDGHVIAGTFQGVGQTGVSRTNTRIARRSLDFPRGNTHPG